MHPNISHNLRIVLFVMYRTCFTTIALLTCLLNLPLDQLWAQNVRIANGFGLRVEDRIIVQAQNGANSPEDVVRVEKEFLKKICQLDPEQLATISKFDGGWANQKAKLSVDGKMLFNANGRPNEADRLIGISRLDLTTLIRGVMAREFKSILTEEQFKQFQHESDAREKFERATSIECLLTILNSTISLSPVQKNQIRNKLEKTKWIGSTSWSYYIQSNNYLYQMPTAAIDEFLSPNQKALVSDLRQHGVQWEIVEW